MTNGSSDAPRLRFMIKDGDPKMPGQSVPTRFLTKELLPAATVFARDDSPVGGVINSIFEPKLYDLYRRSIDR